MVGARRAKSLDLRRREHKFLSDRRDYVAQTLDQDISVMSLERWRAPIVIDDRLKERQRKPAHESRCSLAMSVSCDRPTRTRVWKHYTVGAVDEEDSGGIRMTAAPRFGIDGSQFRA